jgi:hypothetical protein
VSFLTVLPLAFVMIAGPQIISATLRPGQMRLPGYAAGPRLA